MPKKKKLTLKEEKFCQETVATLNPTEAVRRTYNLGSKGGSKTKELSDQTASAIASENLCKPQIQVRLNELLTELKIDKNSRLKRLAEIFYCGDVRAVLGANDQITKMLGEFHDPANKIIDLFQKIEQDFKESPREEEEQLREEERQVEINREAFNARENRNK